VRTPKWSGNLTAAYEVLFSAGSITPSVTAAYNGRFFWSADNDRPQKSYTLINAQVRWASQDDKWNVSLWGKNLADKEYLSILSESSYGDLTRQGDPRTYGVNVGVSF
jgi:iron complex outermembrane receptor protein